MVAIVIRSCSVMYLETSFFWGGGGMKRFEKDVFVFLSRSTF